MTAEVERAYGVPAEIIIAIWGIETDFGNAKDRWDVIRSLATLAYIQYRPPYFRNELLVALKIMHGQGAGQEAARTRFQREAAAVAALCPSSMKTGSIRMLPNAMCEEDTATGTRRLAHSRSFGTSAR